MLISYFSLLPLLSCYLNVLGEFYYHFAPGGPGSEVHGGGVPVGLEEVLANCP